MVMGPGENGPHVVLRILLLGLRILLRRDTDITASGYRYYCVGVRILLRRDTDITASGYGYYCVGGTDITSDADVSVRLIETAESAN